MSIVVKWFNVLKLTSPNKKRFENFRKKSNHFCDTAPYLSPKGEITNIGYYCTWFTYSEALRNFHKNEGTYVHDGGNHFVGSVQDVRLLSYKNVYSCEKLINEKVGLDVVIKEWDMFRHIIEEAGCVVPELRYDLRKVNIYGEWRELPEDSKIAVGKLLEMNRDYFEEKLHVCKDLLEQIKNLRQERLWPFEYNRLKKLSYGAVKYDLYLRGYETQAMIYFFNKNRKVKLTEEEGKMMCLEEIRLKDRDNIKATILDVLKDYEELVRYEDRYDMTEATAYFEQLAKDIPKHMAAADKFTDYFDALIYEVKLFRKAYSLLTDKVVEMSKWDSHHRFSSPLEPYYLNQKYISLVRTPDERKNDPLKLFTIWFENQRYCPQIKFVMAILGGSFAYFQYVFHTRRIAWEKESGIEYGDRTRYFFNREKVGNSKH